MTSRSETVSFKTIEAPYCCGCFGGLELVIDKDANTFNATKLAHQESKRLRNWLNTQHTINLIMCFPSCSDVDTLEAKKEKILKRHVGKKGDTKEIIQGIYIPQELLLSLANWISPECFIKTTKIISNYYINISVEKHREDNEKLNLQVEKLVEKYSEFTNQIEQLTNRNQSQVNQITQLTDQIEHLTNQNQSQVNQITQLTDQIEQLTNRNQCQENQIAQHLAKTKELASNVELLANRSYLQANQINQNIIKISQQASKIKQLEDQLTEQIAQHLTKTNELTSEFKHRIEQLVDQNQQLMGQVGSLQARIEKYEAYERDIVPATAAKSKWHTFILVDKNDGSRSPYYVLRVQRRSRKQRLKHLKIKYPRMEVVFEMDRVPNSINLVNRMRERLTNVKIHFNHLKLLNDYTVHDLIQDIEALANNRQLLKLG